MLKAKHSITRLPYRGVVFAATALSLTILPVNLAAIPAAAWTMVSGQSQSVTTVWSTASAKKRGSSRSSSSSSRTTRPTRSTPSSTAAPRISVPSAATSNRPAWQRPPAIPSGSTAGAAASNKPRVPSVAPAGSRPTYRTPSGGLNMNQAAASKNTRLNSGSTATTKPTMSTAQRNSARQSYYDKPAYQAPKVDRYRSSFSGRGYGMFAGGFLASMLLSSVLSPSPADATTWYAMSDNPEVGTFLNDARAEAQAAGDTEVLAHIDALEQELNAMREHGVSRPSTEQALRTAGIPEAVAYTDAVPLPAGPLTLTMTTGGPKGIYHSLCIGDGRSGFEGLAQVGKRFDLDVLCQTSSGGNDNLRLAATNKAQVFPVQADNLYYYKTRSKQTFGDNEYLLYQEPFLMLTRRKSNIDGLSDISAKSTVYVVGGAELSWNILREFAANDTFLGFGGNTDYARANVRRVNDLDSALTAVSQDPNAVLFLVMGVHAQAIQDIDQRFGEQVRLVPVDDKRFLSIEDPNGGRVYTNCKIPGDALPNLQQGSLWGTNATATLCTDALLVVQQDWVKTLSEDQARQVAMAVLDVIEHVATVAPRLDL